MANYRQYTQCVDISNFNPANPYTQAALVGLYVTLPAAVIPVLMVLGGGNPLVPGAARRDFSHRRHHRLLLLVAVSQAYLYSCDA